ncbi:MAG: hypothetical protein LBU48_01590, partial [Coriobacteriales bacterium]|nr:hypothetical protein [Coriobacteriales bacterium]
MNSQKHVESPQSQTRRRSAITRKLPDIKAFFTAPLFFFGLGLYRAWIELVYVRPLFEAPLHTVAGHDVFDIAMAVVLLICAAASRRLVPLFKKRTLVTCCLVCLLVGTFLNAASLYLSLDQAVFAPLAYLAAIISGLGTALIILLWSELYGCLNPLRVAYYYSGSLMVAALVIFLFNGFVQAYYLAGLVLLPILSLVLLFRSYASVPTQNLPKVTSPRFSFPWKPIALMAVYGFAYGMREDQLYVFMGPHSSLGAIIAAAVVFIGIILIPSRFSLSVIYRVALPVMVCGFLLVPSLFLGAAEFSSICVSMSFTSFSILIMLILSNISYRFGVRAIWLFGIERGLRALFMYSGRETARFLEADHFSAVLQSATFNLLIVVLIVVATMILLSERELSSKWGITFLTSGKAGDNGFEQHRLAEACAGLSKQYALSPRESEVLLLLARQQDLASIE